MFIKWSQQNDQWRFYRYLKWNNWIRCSIWKTNTWLVCKRNTRIRLRVQQNKYWFPNQKWKKTRYWLENLLMNNAILFQSTTHLLFQWYRQHFWLFLDWLRSLKAQQIRNFAAANILNLFLLARALIFNLSEARLHRRRGGPGQRWSLSQLGPTGHWQGPVLTRNQSTCSHRWLEGGGCIG